MGELSAINGVAGAYSERVPIVHIVGVPSTKSQAQGALLHHTLGNGDFRVFGKMYQPISEAVANLIDVRTAAEQIDNLLIACFRTCRPVYIALPSDMAYKEIDSAPLSTPLNLEVPKNDISTENECVERIFDLLYSAKKPIILCDACCVRFHLQDAARELVEAWQCPVFVTPMGKSAVDETHRLYGGVYIGSITQPDVKEHVESSDFILSVGSLKSDFNTGSFSYSIPRSRTVELHSTHVDVQFSTYLNVHMKYVIERLTKEVDVSRLQSRISTSSKVGMLDHHKFQVTANKLTQQWFWVAIGSFFRPYDIVVTETGTANFGIVECRFPPHVTHISQVLWGSIGYSLPACVGAAIAASDEPAKANRVILFIGDGSLQLTAQEISTAIRLGLHITIFFIKNKGYTIERMIHGENAVYNDIQPWDHKSFLPLFSAEKNASYHSAKTEQELMDLLNDESFAQGKGLQLVDLYFDMLDAPEPLRRQAQMTAEANKD